MKRYLLLCCLILATYAFSSVAPAGEVKAPFKEPAQKQSIPPQNKVPIKIPELLPDLTVVISFENVTSSMVGGKMTWTFDLVATVKNLGPGAAGETTVMFEQALVTDLKIYTPAGGDGKVPALAAGAQAEVKCLGKTWVSGTTKHSYLASVDPYNKIAETNEDNNRDAKVPPFLN
jgi:subtilase family serine protease